ncbi:hypothetical protein TURU_096471 [Turdus rufiventris]|nr:hypothetical protein TURU_096471 [Turdus rufiventris]
MSPNPTSLHAVWDTVQQHQNSDSLLEFAPPLLAREPQVQLEAGQIVQKDPGRGNIKSFAEIQKHHVPLVKPNKKICLEVELRRMCSHHSSAGRDELTVHQEVFLWPSQGYCCEVGPPLEDPFLKSACEIKLKVVSFLKLLLAVAVSLLKPVGHTMRQRMEKAFRKPSLPSSKTCTTEGNAHFSQILYFPQNIPNKTKTPNPLNTILCLFLKNNCQHNVHRTLRSDKGFLIVIYNTSTGQGGEYPDISHLKCIAVNTKIELLLLGHSETIHGPFPASARQQPLRWGFEDFKI